MTAPNWEEVEVPRGGYISWGEHVGQHVTGKVLAYDPVGGTDYQDNTCPQLQIELIEPAASFSKDGTRTDYPAGDLVVLNCGLVSLKRAVRTADPAPGDLVKITLANLVKVANGVVKEMSIKIARGAGGRPAPSAPQQAAPAFQQAAPTQAAPAANPFAQPAAAAPAAQAAPPF